MQTILWCTSSRYGAFWAGGKLRSAIAALVLTLIAGISAVQAQTVRITALGDSLTQGYGLLPEQGLVPQLQAWVTERGHDVVIFNAGVSGDTTAGGLSRLDWTLAEPTDGMIVALGGNDLLRGLAPRISRENLEGIMVRLSAEGIPALLVGMPVPANYGPDYQAAFEAMYPDLAQEYGALLVTDMLAPLAAQINDGTPPTEVFQGDMIHPNRVGVGLVVEQLGPQVEVLIARIRENQGS